MIRQLPRCVASALVLLATGCGAGSPAGSPTSRLANQFEARLHSADAFHESEALAIIRLLGPAAAPPLGRAGVSSDPSRRRFIARLLAAAAQAGIRNTETFHLALQLSTDPDNDTRWAARDALLWSRMDPYPERDAWINRDPVAKSFGIDRDYPLPDADTALARLRRAFGEAGIDPRDIPRMFDRMPLVRREAGIDAYAGLPFSSEEKLLWIVQCARAGESDAVAMLQACLEPEPNKRLGRKPSQMERDWAFRALNAHSRLPHDFHR